MDITNMAFTFIGLGSDVKRLEIIKKLGTHPINHATFAHHLTLMGHPHDWLVYCDLMKKL